MALTMLLVAAQLAGGTLVFPRDAYLSTEVAGLERTGARAERVMDRGEGFAQALKVTVPRAGEESNATQLTILNTERIEAGDVLLATFHVRGISVDGKNPASTTFMFEKATSPWTKSTIQTLTAHKNPSRWQKGLFAFEAVEGYAPGQAMASFRFAGQAQTILLGGVTLLNYRKSRSLAELQRWTIDSTPLGSVTATLRRDLPQQTMLGFGGNFCQPRYGRTEAMDAVGQYCLDNLNVAHARIGIPLNDWNPEPGKFVETGQAGASLKALQIMAKRGIPTVASVWEGPLWMLPGAREASGRRLAPDLYDECIDAIARYLVLARDKYGVEVGYFSFNEPDYGVNFKFDPSEMAAFIRQAGPEFVRRGLKTKFLVADTANGVNFPAYARPLLTDRTIAPYLGPLAFHNWDSLSAPDGAYKAIADLGREFKKPVWCMEAGHDAQLWQTRNPWASWENGLRTALAYERTIRLTKATVMNYWTYQDNYPLVSQDGKTPYPVFRVMQQMEKVFGKGAVVVPAVSDSGELRILGTKSGAALIVNPVGAGRLTLRGLTPKAKYQLAVSTEARQGAGTSLVASPLGVLSFSVPSRSVLTVTPR